MELKDKVVVRDMLGNNINGVIVYATNVKDFISYAWVNPGDIREKVQI